MEYNIIWTFIAAKPPTMPRRSFLIDEEGQIIHIIRDVDVTTHSKDILAALSQSGSPL